MFRTKKTNGLKLSIHTKVLLGYGVIIFLMAFILVIPYTIYSLNKWFE